MFNKIKSLYKQLQNDFQILINDANSIAGSNKLDKINYSINEDQVEVKTRTRNRSNDESENLINNINDIEKITLNLNQLTEEIRKDINSQEKDLVKLENIIEDSNKNWSTTKDSEYKQDVILVKGDNNEEEKNGSVCYTMGCAVVSLILFIGLIYVKYFYGNISQNDTNK